MPTRPSRGTATGRVWEIADEETRRTGRLARRADVIGRYQAEGGNYNTASTQYHHWRTHQETKVEAKPVADPIYLQLEIKEGGRILLPAEVRAAMGVVEGDVLSAVVTDGELSLMSQDVAIRQIQAMVRKHVPEGVSLVDELIAERRAEEARESGR